MGMRKASLRAAVFAERRVDPVRRLAERTCERRYCTPRYCCDVCIIIIYLLKYRFFLLTEIYRRGFMQCQGVVSVACRQDSLCCKIKVRVFRRTGELGCFIFLQLPLRLRKLTGLPPKSYSMTQDFTNLSDFAVMISF